MRLATPLHPILDNMYAETFFFFVPYRTVWDDFEKFHGAQDDPGDSIDFTMPILGNDTAISEGDLGDYMGIPIGLLTDTTDVNALPFRAYRKIWTEWFRDENLQDSLVTLTDAGPDIGGYGAAPKIRGKRFDYFTSCLPAPQKGTAITLPVVAGAGTFAELSTEDNEADGNLVGIANTASGDGYSLLDLVSTHLAVDEDSSSIKGLGGVLGIDFTGSQVATINDLRLAFQTQRLLERDARAGTRYVESLRAHWGVTSPDHRLQRSEFLGGGSSAVNVTPVAQTSGQPTPVSDDALGQLAGFGTVSGSHSFSKSFVEHGVLMGIVNVRGDITYSQGLDRMWSKATRYDYYYPVLSQIGEQSVLNKEIWHNDDANDDLVFGYQERYAEYRHANSRLTGLMRVDAPSTLRTWHLSEDFGSLPTLGSTFITANTSVPLDRAIAVSTEPHFIADFFFNIKAARPLPLYGVPGNMDRL